jgi:acetolactate synthase-1/2/3 large subunit
MPAPAPLTENCAAGVIARLLKARRIDRVFGLCAESVERAAALQRALAANRVGRPALLDVLVSGDAVSSDAKSGLAWVPDLQPLAAWDEAERRWRGTAPG